MKLNQSGLILLFAIITLVPILVCAQVDSSDRIEYTPEFLFNDGIFTTFEQVKRNQPVSVVRIVSSLNPENPDYFNDLLSKENISYVDDFGVIQSISVKRIWGYARQGVLYINWNGTFNRIPVIGKAAHFVATKKVYHESMSDPFYYGYPNYAPAYSTDEMYQYLIDFDDGNVVDFDLSAFEYILAKDKELYIEFVQLKKRKKKQMKFLYLRKYNERNPLYFPKS